MLRKTNDPYTHLSQQPHNKLMWLVIFYYFFTKIKEKKKKKNILSATSACCEAVVRNECKNHFSLRNDIKYLDFTFYSKKNFLPCQE
jgi:hypothetical protein